MFGKSLFQSSSIVWSTDNFVTKDTILADNYNPSNFKVTIPSQANGSIVKYYFVVNDNSNYLIIIK